MNEINRDYRDYLMSNDCSFLKKMILPLGMLLGSLDGIELGSKEGELDGTNEGKSEGSDEGSRLG